MDNFIEIYEDHVKIREATKQGYAIATDGDSINLEQPNSKTRRGRVGHSIAQTLTCSCNQGVITNKDNINNKGENNMKEFKNETLTKLKFNMPENMKEIRLFDSFAGIGSLHNSLQFLGIPTKIIGLSETDVDATISYACVHIDNFLNLDFNYPSEQEIREWLINRNIGWDFQKQKSCIPRLKKDKLYKVYKASVLLDNYGDISQIDYKNLPDFDLFNFSFPCFIAGTLILTDKGYKKIEDIKKGDRVLTHTNTYQKVVKPMINKANKIYKLKTMCSEDLFVTEEHPFYVRKRIRVANNNMPHLKRGRGYERKFLNPEWVRVKDLSKDYYVGIAINQKSQLPEWNGCTVPRPYGRTKQLNKLKKYFNNKDFWWIVGRYIGDGWVKNTIDHKGTDIYDLYICCAKNELYEITEVLDRLNKINNDFKYKYYEDRTVYRIRIANVEFAKYLQQFGKYAYGKHLTNDIFDLPIELLKSFIIGYISADGCYTQNRYKCSSVSKELIYGIGQCVAKAFNTPYSIYKTKRKPIHKIEGRIVNQRDSYECCFKLEKNKQDKAFYEDGYIWCPINGLYIEEYNDFVYNMEVENDNSYTANNIIVHNCTDISNAGKQKGLKNEDGTPTRSGLVKYGIDLIRSKKPKYIMIENVKALIQKKFIDDFYDIINEIESIGYKCYYPTKEDKKGNKVPCCLNAKNYAIPQNRERIFVICVRSDCNDSIEEFWEGKDFGYRLKDFLENTVDEKYYLSQQIQDRFKRNEVEDTEHNDLNVVGTSDPNKKIGQRDITYGTNGIMSTLTATDYKQPKQILDNKEYSFKLDGNNFNQRKVINLSEGILRTISGQGHCGNEPKTCVPFTNNYGEIKERSDGMCTCLDTRYSSFPDNHNQRTGVIEKNVIDEKYYLDKPWHFSDEKDEKHDTNEIAQIDNIKYKADRSISDPNLFCRTLDTMSGGQKKPKVIEEKYFIDKIDRKQVYKEKENYIQWDTSGKGYNSQNDRAFYENKNIGTIPSNGADNKTNIIQGLDTKNFRIRKLTPKECWRLMGFTDKQFDRAKESGISDSQLYKQAGNSIVVNCLYYIFKELFKNYIVEDK